MSSIDVSAEIEIAASPADVAGVMFDPQREPEWITPVTGVEIIDPALQPGARVRRSASVMGHDVSWLTEVEQVHFPHVLVLKVVDSPFVGTVRYDIQRSPGGSRARVRGTGTAPQLRFVPASVVSAPIKKALGEALERLKSLIEPKPAQ
jgi:hypothetical protein